MTAGRRVPTYVVRVSSPDAEEARVIAEALVDVPEISDEDVARLLATSEGPLDAADAHVVVAPADRAPATDTKKPVFLVRRDGVGEAGTFPLGPELEGIETLRAALLDEALRALGVTVDRARRAKRPFATALIAGAALVAGAEGLLPGAAAFVVSTQVSAIASLYYLYTGRWMGRSQALTLLPVFASEAAGGSVFLLIKSFLPPTGVADAAAAVVSASMTIAMLGAVARLLEAGYTLDETEKLRAAFQRMRARTKAERAQLARNRTLFRDKHFLRDLVRRLVFD
jgi:hypothetical protein